MEESKSKSKTKIDPLKDYYAILNLRPDATLEDVGSAFFKFTELCGPAVSTHGKTKEQIQELEKKYTDVCEAFEVLGDKRNRQEYDQRLAKHRQQSGDVRAIWSKLTAPPAEPQPYLGASSKQPKIQALAYAVEAVVTLKEAIKGTRFSFTISDPTPCEDCAGLKPVNRMQCQTCRGLGYFNVDREEEMVLPPNLFDGMEIRKPELGRYDLRAQRNGDLIIKIKVKEHPHLTIAGKDLQCNVPVSLYEAVLGAEIEVPTATGKVVMKIQPLTQTGRVYRLKGMGLAGGDQLVKIEVFFPQKMSAEEIAMFKKMRDMHNEPNPRRNFFAR
jgi:DnaJ-class molecular chaperone